MTNIDPDEAQLLRPRTRGAWTGWGWLRLLIVPVTMIEATRGLIYFKKQRENKRADALVDATVDAIQQRGQSKNSSHLAVENALLRELVETQQGQLQVLQEELEAVGWREPLPAAPRPSGSRSPHSGVRFVLCSSSYACDPLECFEL
jgi:hypothetical protein